MSNHVAGSEYCIQENIIAITLGVFDPNQEMGWLAQLQEHEGARAVYEVIIESAKAFGRAEELFGAPDEDYDWTKAIEVFVSGLRVSEHISFAGLYDLAKRAIEASKYRSKDQEGNSTDASTEDRSRERQAPERADERPPHPQKPD